MSILQACFSFPFWSTCSLFPIFALVNGQILFILLAVISINSHVFMALSVFPSINKCHWENTFCTRINIHPIYFFLFTFIFLVWQHAQDIFTPQQWHTPKFGPNAHPIFCSLFLFYDTERVWNELRQEYSSFTKIRLDDWVGWSWIITFRIDRSLPKTKADYNNNKILEQLSIKNGF